MCPGPCRHTEPLTTQQHHRASGLGPPQCLTNWQQMCSSALCGPQRRHNPGAVVLWYSVATLGPIQHGAVRARFARGSLKFVSSHAGACRTEVAVRAASSSRVSGPGLVLCRRHHEHDTSSAGGSEFAMSVSAFNTCGRDRIDPCKQVMPASRRVAARFSFASLHRPPCQIFPRRRALR
jgi:hypothetical protein